MKRSVICFSIIEFKPQLDLKPMLGNVLTENTLILGLISLACLSFLSLTGGNVDDFLKSVNRQLNNGFPSSSSVSQKTLTPLGGLSSEKDKEQGDAQKLAQAQTSLSLADRKLRDPFPNLPKKEAFLTLSNGQKISLKMADDALAYETLGPNGMVQNRLAMIYQLTDSLEAQGYSKDVVEEVRDLANAGHRMAQVQGIFDSFWKQDENWKNKQPIPSINEYLIKNGGTVSFGTNSKPKNLKQIAAEIYVSKNSYFTMQKKIVNWCGSVSNLPCLRARAEQMKTDPIYINHRPFQFAMQQHLMEQSLSSKKQSEVKNIVNGLSDEIWAITSDSYWQGRHYGRSIGNSSRLIKRKSNQICSYSKTSTCQVKG